MRAAKSIPWDDDRTALYRTIFPQMTSCLPDEEGAQLRFDFETELAPTEGGVRTSNTYYPPYRRPISIPSGSSVNNSCGCETPRSA